jgi:Tol biopolymer transport system component
MHCVRLDPSKDVTLVNRIGPSKSELWIANADASDARKLFQAVGFDYHASFSQDRKWIVFISERKGSGRADLYRVHPDGSGLMNGHRSSQRPAYVSIQ